jgi:hypothetical protein
MGMVAVLSTIVMVALAFFHALSIMPLALKHTILASPPFIPPRQIMQ